MKRVISIFILGLFGILSLFGCEQPTTYNLSIETVESFYSINTELTLSEGSATIEVSIAPLVEGTSTEVSLGLEVYVDTTYATKRELWQQSLIIEISEEGVAAKSLMVDGSLLEAELFYVSVTQVTGTFTSIETVEPNNKTYLLPSYEVGYVIEPEEDPFEIIDLEVNQANLTALNEQLDGFFVDQATVEHLQYTLKNTLEVKSEYGNDYSSSSVYFKMKSDGTYIEFLAGGVTQVYLYKDNRYFIYEYGPDNYQSGKYLIDPIAVDLVEDYEGYDPGIMDFEIDEYVIDPEVMLIEVIDDGYKVTAYLTDLLSKDDYDAMVEQMASLGLEIDLFDDAIMELTYLIYDTTLSLKASMLFEMEEPVEMSIRSTVTQTISFNYFKPIDFTQSQFEILPPNSIGEVTEVTDFSTPYTSTVIPRNLYYKTYLEEGQYLINDVENVLSVRLFDNEGKEVVNDRLPQYSSPYLFIEEEGYYYVEVDWRTTGAWDGWTLSFDKLDYETIVDPSNATPLSNGENALQIEGEHDFEVFSYTATAPTLLKFTPSTSEQFTLFYDHPSFYSIHYEYFFGTNSVYVELGKGNHLLYVSSTNELDTTFEVETIDVSAYKNSNFQSMVELTEQFSNEIMYTSEILGTGYMKLHVDEKAYYTFHYEGVKQITTLFAHVYDSKGTLLDYNGISESYGIVLEPGDYIVHFDSNNLSAGKARYEKVLYETTNQTIELGEFPTMSPYAEGFPEPIESFHFNRDHLVNSWFTLDQDSIVFILSDHYRLFKEDGTQLGIYFDHLGYYGTYFALDAGTYYLQKINDQVTSSRTYYIRMAIITGDIVDDDIAGSSIKSITTGQTDFSNDSQYDSELVKFELATGRTINYIFTMNTFVYDENGNFIFNDFSYGSKYLEAGTYYFFFAIGNSNNSTISITIN